MKKDISGKGDRRLKTRRNEATYGYYGTIGQKPVAHIRTNGKEDILTAEEFIEDLYGKKVKEIVFE
ncbi:MAG: hypothetical protein IJ058_14355 [Lachnospiraceae bacterium]|nr:hypothetical protein [Lachnospiraceae bacterium]MBQ8947963.1 hypothetical protein [Lachnospiraceae bacterium]